MASMTPEQAVFRCREPECGGLVFPQTKVGRYFYHRGVHIELPVTMVVPRCGKCSKDYLSDLLIELVNQVLEVEYKRHEALIKTALDPKRKTTWWN